MRMLIAILLAAVVGPFTWPKLASADSHGESLARWINERGRQAWGEPPAKCDDFTFARRVYLDIVGRTPSVSELRDFQDLGDNRRDILVDRLIFGEGPRSETYLRLGSQNLARYWRRVLIPPGTTIVGSPLPLENWLKQSFSERTPYDEIMRDLTAIRSPGEAGSYYQLLGSLPENYASHLTRSALGVRIECAQCHDHPFVDWKQEDFWGLAAFYGNLRGPRDALARSGTEGSITYEGKTYPAKFLWTGQPLDESGAAPRAQLATWMTSTENPQFSATAVNRIWQYLVGHGLYADIDNLDQATPEEREFLDEVAQRFARDGFDVQGLMAAICKSDWYQAQSTDQPVRPEGFQRQLKVLSPDQVFDSLEQALLLPISRIDPDSPRWSGERSQLVNRLSETVGTTPEDYASGIPQALMLMNGRLTSDAIDLENSRLLRAVVETPFFNDHARIKTLFLAVLTREPTEAESAALVKFVNGMPEGKNQQEAYGEILWALLNSPEFVLCR
ncbi:DUF1553 domain-containing protein [bacterium]|nr:DUF1553 domain-containing protein [bacterium]